MLLGGGIRKAVYAGGGCQASDFSHAGTARYVMGKEAPSHGVLGQSDYNLQGNCGETRIHDDYPWSGNFSTKIKCVYVYNYSVKKAKGTGAAGRETGTA